ncbi:MAG: Rieske (2Fe-2S) protein [Acidimicrobiales bacterium]
MVAVGVSACGGSPGSNKTARTAGTPSSSPKGGPLAAAADIPVGDGKIFADQNVVVTEPEPGTFHGFSAICTHLGCTVTTVDQGTINCPCHGSRFSISDGSVQAGPAPRPLPRAQITVAGGSISLA